jgi:hypothetical protein
MSFRLVQRLSASPEGRNVNPFGSNPGVSKVLLNAGAQVSLDYMGSSEFEFDTAVKSGNNIVSVAKELKIVTQTLVRPTYSEYVHFVCTDEQATGLLPEWHEWTKDPRNIEPMGYFNDDSMDRIVGLDVVGWWAMDENLIWTRQIEVAEKILGAFVTLSSKEV